MRDRLLCLSVLVLLVACGTGGASPNGDRIRVVATTTVLADLVRIVGGDLVQVDPIVPPGAEVHTFDPSPADAARVSRAQVVFVNGLGLDAWLADLAAEAGAGGVPTVGLAEALPGVTYLAGDAAEGTAQNPHLWMNVMYAAFYVDRIAETLAGADPAHAEAIRAQGAAARARLEALDAETRTAMEAIPAADRRVISFHDAFPYFAAAYGLTVVGTVVDAPGQDPSAGQVAALVDAVRDHGVRAILSEAQFPQDLVETLAAETGVAVVSDLYTDSVGPAPADTFEGLIRWDAARIVDALR